MTTYILIFFLKIFENAVNTLRLLYTSSNQKLLSSLLQMLCSLLFITTTSLVVINIKDDFFIIIVFSLGCTIGSYIGSLLEEKIALGNNIIICITELDIMDDIRNNGYKLTSTKGTGLDIKNIIFIMTTRKKKRKLVKLLKELDENIFIMSGNATYENH